MPDPRAPFFSPPAWVTTHPITGKPLDDDSDADIYGLNEFTVIDALDFSSTGGVYRGEKRPLQVKRWCSRKASRTPCIFRRTIKMLSIGLRKNTECSNTLLERALRRNRFRSSITKHISLSQWNTLLMRRRFRR